jgi:hypothetical protein
VKAIQVEGYGDKWLISMLEPNPWNPCGPTVYRIGGIAQTYSTEAEANAVIATIKPPDRLNEGCKLPPIDPNEKPRRVHHDAPMEIDKPLPEAHVKHARVKHD